jgi:hypothetical protein
MTQPTSRLSRSALLMSFSLVALSGHAFGDEPQMKRVVMPAHGAALDVGSKHIVSYFTAGNGACDVTLLIGNKADDTGDNGSIGTRVKFAVLSGMTARTDTAEGKSLEISCAPGASAMSIRPVDLMAYVAPAKR